MVKENISTKVACVETIELIGKKADGSLGKLRFSCDNETLGHQDHYQIGLLSNGKKSDKETRYSIIWKNIIKRLPINSPSARN